MNKTVSWILGIIVVAGIALAIWQIVETKKPAQEETAGASSQSQTSSQNTSSGKKMAFTQFIKQGGSYQCVVNQYVNDIESTGEVFIDAGKIRGNFVTNTNGMTIDSSSIIRDGFAYTWTSTSTKGWKVPVVAAENDNLSAAVGTYSFNTDQIGDYDCKPWIADQSKFIIPATITFQEMKA